MENTIYHIYVLRLENDRFYVGATKNLRARPIDHFGRGGAIATKESKPVDLVKVVELKNYMVGKDSAHNRLEVIVASRIAKKYGKHMVRGAKHGKGWSDQPTQNNSKIYVLA